MTTSEVDRVFRLKKGTAREAAVEGHVRSAKRERGSYDCYLIAPEDARELWGPR